MNALVYRLSYWFGMAPWDVDRIAPQVEQAFQAGDYPAGHALDLGCGTGNYVIYMAHHGLEAIGIDYIPQAIARARKKAKQAGVSDRTQFLIADVTKMADLHLPDCGFALDMGCFHGLAWADQRKYAQALAGTLLPGGRYLLYALDPRKEAGLAYGLTQDQITTCFSPWFDLERCEQSSFRGHDATWYWWKRKDLL